MRQRQRYDRASYGRNQRSNDDVVSRDDCVQQDERDGIPRSNESLNRGVKAAQKTILGSNPLRAQAGTSRLSPVSTHCASASSERQRNEERMVGKVIAAKVARRRRRIVRLEDDCDIELTPCERSDALTRERSGQCEFDARMPIPEHRYRARNDRLPRRRERGDTNLVKPRASVHRQFAFGCFELLGYQLSMPQ